ncbi:two-component system, chemotaxis family, CheB/CheR fusion protein [Maridesulfovibrio ferrireducens]|uniref:protein-glutamate O-methyltransferase n=1 Tax=Maridesulfovibrio ferrireducens TaxID=246191 RepID=A0A1G9AU88_9BACT|nr:chemotaxis protein CheB [Maridesulfovibrio ferrireducens]SDK30145.1 two-component system, chemotaxis family, CheB/CheR fusion protein [Maridesulfovibrio ferrireducens]
MGKEKKVDQADSGSEKNTKSVENMTSQDQQSIDHYTPEFPIVGIGASAGGLEALESFLRNVPEESGMAFVIVQHLDPSQKGSMVSLLQRYTSMPVFQVEDGIKIKPDHVYIIAPGKEISILQGVLHQFEPTQRRGLRLPIDSFFQSLAEDRHINAIGVVLSGMGSDGMLGLRAIKEEYGMTFVQNPDSAKFNSMPLSSIDAGLADVVAPARELPLKITNCLKRTLMGSDKIMTRTHQDSMGKIVLVLRSQTGHDFSQYKKSSIYRRVERRMGVHQIDKMSQYVRFLRENPQEVDLLFKEILIGVTNFFRDPEIWEHLKRIILPAMMKDFPDGETMRVWMPGCSTGEEAYSLSMVFNEVLEGQIAPKKLSIQIFATDLDNDAIDKARMGVYPQNISSDVSKERLLRFFTQEGEFWRIESDIRDTVIFAPQNIIMDPPFTKLDIIVCRNLLIYLDQELQKKLIPMFHYSLNPNGVLLLGSSESLGIFTDLFTPLEAKMRLYKRLDSDERHIPTLFSRRLPPLYSPVIKEQDPKTPIINVQSLMEQLILKNYAPAAVLATSDGDILNITGHTGKFLEPPAGKANWNLFAMAREGLRFRLSSAFIQAFRDQTVTTIKGVHIEDGNSFNVVDVVIHPLAKFSQMKNMLMVLFSAGYSPEKDSSVIVPTVKANILGVTKGMQHELQQARDEVQFLKHEMQTSQEDLKNSNEEMQSTNEELQSMNEELMTSKEEMQSMNEELQTVNQELKVKIDNLYESNNDMKNLLDSTNIATLFLDEDLNIRRFTAQATTIFKLLPGDVSRPFTDIVSNLDYPEMSADAEEVMKSLIYSEKDISSLNGMWYKIRIMPYRTDDNKISGLVITFSNISQAKHLETMLRLKEREALDLFTEMPNPFALLDSVFDEKGNFVEAQVVLVNEAYEHLMAASDVKKTLHEIWPGIEQAAFEACKETVMTGKPNSFEQHHGRLGKKIRGFAYRPGVTPKRFCLLFEVSS